MGIGPVAAGAADAVGVASGSREVPVDDDVEPRGVEAAARDLGGKRARRDVGQLFKTSHPVGFTRFGSFFDERHLSGRTQSVEMLFSFGRMAFEDTHVEATSNHPFPAPVATSVATRTFVFPARKLRSAASRSRWGSLPWSVAMVWGL